MYFQYVKGTKKGWYGILRVIGQGLSAKTLDRFETFILLRWGYLRLVLRTEWSLRQATCHRELRPKRYPY